MPRMIAIRVELFDNLRNLKIEKSAAKAKAENRDFRVRGNPSRLRGKKSVTGKRRDRDICG